MKRMVVLMVGLMSLAVGRGQDRYAEAAKVLAAHPGLEKRVSAGGVRLELRGLFLCGGLLWISLRGENRSPVDFRGTAVRFMLQDRHRVRREAIQTIVLEPVVSRGIRVLQSDSCAVLCFGLVPRVPGRKRVLVIEWGERNGDRRMWMRLKGKDVLKAKKLK